jgi:hypothetical protein
LRHHIIIDYTDGQFHIGLIKSGNANFLASGKSRNNKFEKDVVLFKLNACTLNFIFVNIPTGESSNNGLAVFTG